MEKVIIKISSYVGLDVRAEHYYAAYENINDDRDVYQVAKDPDIWSLKYRLRLEKELTALEAGILNRKDSSPVKLKKGDKTERFDSITEIKDAAKKEFPDADLIFFETSDDKINEDINIVYKNKQDYIKTGQKIKIKNMRAFGPQFANLEEGSVHDVIETPLRYSHQGWSHGYWVMGVGEPVLVLKHEAIDIKLWELINQD